VFADNSERFNYNTADPLGNLSTQEYHMFMLYVRGNNITEIKDRLDLSGSIVKALQKRIYKRLNVDSIKQLKELAGELGYR